MTNGLKLITYTYNTRKSTLIIDISDLISKIKK